MNTLYVKRFKGLFMHNRLLFIGASLFKKLVEHMTLHPHKKCFYHVPLRFEMLQYLIDSCK